jgi:TrmH family RNA methyltransferase
MLHAEKPRSPIGTVAVTDRAGNPQARGSGAAELAEVSPRPGVPAGVRFVLVGTTHPGNIGGAARAMKTMGLRQLYLVAPKVYPSAEATAWASGADDVLATAAVCSDLDQALAGCVLVVGTSARSRRLPWPELEPRAAAEELVRVARAAPVAVVFGRERSGLSNEELDRCHFLVSIPTDQAYPSLNLAAAVQVLAYELLLAARGAPEAAGLVPKYAAAEDLERLYRHLEETLVALGFLDPENPRQLMRRLRRLFARARLEETEVAILRGILTAAGQGVRRRGSGGDWQS